MAVEEYSGFKKKGGHFKAYCIPTAVPSFYSVYQAVPKKHQKQVVKHRGGCVSICGHHGKPLNNAKERSFTF